MSNTVQIVPTIFATIVSPQKEEGTVVPAADLELWFSQLCFALEFIHSQKVIHRDIKVRTIEIRLGGI